MPNQINYDGVTIYEVFCNETDRVVCSGTSAFIAQGLHVSTSWLTNLRLGYSSISDPDHRLYGLTVSEIGRFDFVFDAYKGDSYLKSGTIAELSAALNRKPEVLRHHASDSYKQRSAEGGDVRKGSAGALLLYKQPRPRATYY